MQTSVGAAAICWSESPVARSTRAMMNMVRSGVDGKNHCVPQEKKQTSGDQTSV
jgi:hypothetical protein